jgi:arsenate reductase
MTVTIYHNPKCKISRDVLKVLRTRGVDPIVVEYMKDPPGRSDLVRLLNLLRLSPRDIMREKESRELGLDRNGLDLNAALNTLARNPALIERPIVMTTTKGRICRSPELAEQFVTEALEFA